MPSTERYAVQTFKKMPQGGFAIGRSIPCKSLEDALSKAARSYSGGQECGAAAYLLKGDELIGETEDPVAVGVFGTCPPDITDDIPY